MDKRKAALIALAILTGAALLVGGYITADHWVAIVTQGLAL